MNILNTPIAVGNIEIPNRLVMPPMATAKSNADGTVSDALCAYYAEKSAGGYIGLVITEHSYIAKEGQASAGQLSLDEHCDMGGLKQLTAAIHKNGAKVFCQLNHAGAGAQRAVTGHTPLSPSGVRTPHSKADVEPPATMNEADIAKVVRDFAAAAVRAKEAGFDGVEIHSAHAYLLNQFFSPLTNRRTDAYCGATMEGRIHLHLQVIAAVRAAVGDAYPIALRLGACDYMDGGSTIADGVAACEAFEKAGVDLLDISGGLCFYTKPGDATQGYFREITAAVKEKCHLPVILTGGITTADAAEQLLETHQADMIGVGRAVLKNSLWAKEAMESLQ